MNITINWESLAQVFFAAVGFSTGIVGSFAIGVRLLTNAQHAVPGARKGKSKDVQREVVYRVLSYAAFSVCISALLYGIYLIVPYFHLDK